MNVILSNEDRLNFQLSILTTEQQVAFCIYCSLEVNKDATFAAWATDWLSGIDRTRISAYRMTRIALGTKSGSIGRAAWAAESAAVGKPENVAVWVQETVLTSKCDFSAMAKKASKLM